MIVVDIDRCVGCGYCGLSCPQLALSLYEDTCILLYPDRCIGCGICEDSCSFEVIVVLTDDLVTENSIKNGFMLQGRNQVFPC